MATYAFSGGSTGYPGYGDRWQVGFSGTWAAGDTWSLEASTGDAIFTLGLGVFDNQNPRVCMTYRERMYIGLVSRFLASNNDDPTSYEEQAPGATFVDYQSQFGIQDTIQALSQMQGRLIVFAQHSIQIWTVDADPSLFNLVQTLDNLGSSSPLSVQNLGDYDVIFLDSTGFRSLRSREVTLNAVPEDIGIPIDSLVQTDLETADPADCCGIVEPASKRYWCYINGKIYVLTRYVNSKITAWSTYIPTDSDGIAFTPKKFVVYNGLIYVRASNIQNDGDILLAYGGTNGTTYDATIATLTIPWLDDGRPKQKKYAQGFDLGAKGGWDVRIGMDPNPGTLQLAYSGVSVVGTDAKDSTYDLEHVKFEQIGTHFQIQAKTQATWTSAATLSALVFHYNPGER